jgi:HEAT repeat protein
MRPATMARGATLESLAQTTWVPWFDLQSQRWLPARTLPRANGTTVDVQQLDVVNLLRGSLADADPAVRAAATWALGQLGAPPALLRPQLDDAAWEVRCNAVAGLAAIGSAAAVHVLLEVAGNDDRQDLRPLALAALAVCRRGDAAGDALAAETLRASNDPLLLGAAAAFARMRGVDAAQVAAQARLDGDATVVVRTQLAAAFGGDADAAIVATLTRTASGRGPEGRVAGGTGLARTRHALALPALLTAFELEHDLAARTGLLLAIGEHGGDAARDFLIEQAEKGQKALRGWAGLALGVWGRERDDALAAPALRTGLAREGNQSARGQWLLGLGLLRDLASRPVLEQHAREGDSLARAASVQALGLLGGASVQPFLIAILHEDDCPFVRSSAAAVLGATGDGRAIAALGECTRGDANVEVREAAALALGATGDRAAAEPLRRLARGDSGLLRAAALRGLGRLFAAHGEARFAPLAWQAVPRSVPDLLVWLAGMDR